MKEALLYDKLEKGKVRCNVCNRRCIIDDGKRGFCLTRLNQNGKLFSLTYGKVSTLAYSPIEKKPVFHFYPGSIWLSIGSLGCNFRCPGCQNWEIAHSRVDFKDRSVQNISAEKLVSYAKAQNSIGISWTYNEPTLWFEYTLDGVKLAKEANLHTNYVTNGYITQEALDLIGPYLDVFRVDIKGFSEKTYNKIGHISDFKKILDATERAKKKWKMHVEIVTNIIPDYNDDMDELRGIASWIVDILGSDTPWHVTQFYPHLELSHLPPTPVAKLEKAREIGLEQGLHYVYLGNVPGHRAENTYCHNCGELLIERNIFSIASMNLADGKCPKCHTAIPIILKSKSRL